MGDSTCLDVVLTAVEGFIVERQLGLKYGKLFFNFTAFGVDAMVSHDFSVGGPVVQLIRGFGQGVELVPWQGEEVTEPNLDGFGCGYGAVRFQDKLGDVDCLIPFPPGQHLDLPHSQPPNESWDDMFSCAEGDSVGHVAQVGFETSRGTLTILSCSWRQVTSKLRAVICW